MDSSDILQCFMGTLVRKMKEVDITYHSLTFVPEWSYTYSGKIYLILNILFNKNSRFHYSYYNSIAIQVISFVSFYIILREMAANTKQSKLSAKDEECTFTWKIFTSWDYGIANVETAHNKVTIYFSIKYLSSCGIMLD